jgi:hypothetical protein
VLCTNILLCLDAVLELKNVESVCVQNILLVGKSSFTGIFHRTSQFCGSIAYTFLL